MWCLQGRYSNCIREYRVILHNVREVYILEYGCHIHVALTHTRALKLNKNVLVFFQKHNL